MSNSIRKDKGMYYIYELWETKSNTPVYVGYGKHNRKSGRERYKDHLHEALSYEQGKITNTNKLNKYKINVILQVLNEGFDIIYKFPYNNLSYEDACNKERQLINEYGRRCVNTGTLTNIDEGGRGSRTLTEETKRKISKAHKGKLSPLKGRVLGEYTDERKAAIQNGVCAFNKTPEGVATRKAAGQKKEGHVPWNKGKTKDNDTRVAKYALEKTGQKRDDMVGNVPWNKGKTKANNKILNSVSKKMTGRDPWNKGKTTDKKGKSYEEIYGKEIADQMKKARQNTAWVHNHQETKKIKIDELGEYQSNGWVRGRLSSKRK